MLARVLVLHDAGQGNVMAVGLERNRLVGARNGERLGTIAALMLVAAVVSGFLAGCAGELPHTAPPVVRANQTPTPPPPTPTATPDPMVLRNVALGCNPAGPAPQPRVVYTGLHPGTPGPAPREVALTFDDGPTPYTSPPILSYLEQSHTPATFFVEGQYIHEWPYLLQRQWNDGFAIGVHTWDHPLMTRLTVMQVHHQFADTIQQIHSILGPSACIWLWRPPYADYNASVLQAAVSFGLTTVTWDDSSVDWTRPGVQQIVNNVMTQMHPGAIVLMHDGPALRDQTAAALPQIVAGLRARGLVPVTLPALLADGQYPGVRVTSTPGMPETPVATRTPGATRATAAAEGGSGASTT
jgi:peptidoglycan/xylan/chitin deacetylase (PgdA/CDA1 family)